MRLVPKFLHPDLETFACSFKGHTVPAAEVARLRPEDEGLGMELQSGERLVRCVRCDAWIRMPCPRAAARDVLPPLIEIEVPRRGRALRDVIVLRLIAVDRALHSLVFALIAAALLFLDVNLDFVRAQVQGVLRLLEAGEGQVQAQAAQGFLSGTLRSVLHLQKHALLVLGLTALAYCIVEGVEAVGLWLEKRWAEYLTALATAGLLPFEIHELLDRITVLRLGAFIVNLAILGWLVWVKRLFGVRGGPSEADDLDREALFTRREAPTG